MEFDWVGTLDPTAYLSVPAALECMLAGLDGITTGEYRIEVTGLNEGETLIVRVYTGALVEFKITELSFDGGTASVTFNSVPGQSYSVEQANDLLGWLEVDDPTATDSTTTVTIFYDPVATPKLFIRIREL